MKENNRTVKNDCKREVFDSFIKRLKNIPQLMQKGYKPASENIKQERYSFACEYEHISIVYETSSKTLVITAEDVLSKLLGIELELAEWEANKTQNYGVANKNGQIHVGEKSTFLNDAVKKQNKEEPSDKRQNLNNADRTKGRIQNQDLVKNQNPVQKPMQNGEKQKTRQDKSTNENQGKIHKNAKAENINTNDFAQKDIKQKTDKNKNPMVENKKSETAKIAPKERVKKQETIQPEQKTRVDQIDNKIQTTQKNDKFKKEKATEAIKTIQKEKADEAAKVAEIIKSPDELYKNGFSIKKFEAEKFDAALKKIKELPGVACRQTVNAEGSKTYIIHDDKNRVYLRYVPTKKTLQMQGRRSKLFGEVQVLVSQNSDYVTAVSSHIDLTGEEKQARNMEKQLKKLFPVAFDFLSEQSRIDLTIGMIDISNKEVRLSDYSMLLVPPYRGLERLIYDLLRARGIEVKMIGQAYEKQDGNYVLKLGYRRKSGSIVYAEVMSALYSEYFAKRNFYAHSDITGDLLSRVIAEKSAAEDIFASLVNIIEYNIGKLKETGFKLAN